MNTNEMVNTTLSATTLRSCFASPMRNIRPNEKPDHFKDINRIGGFYDEKHSPHKDSLLTRSSGPVQAHDLAYEINLETAVHVEKKAIYGGIIAAHFGHFLLETLSRTWYLIDSTDDIYFYVVNHPRLKGTYDELKGWQKEILSALVQDVNRIKIIYTPTLFNELVIPQAGCITRQLLAEQQVAALVELGNKITAKCAPSNISGKVWLSRSNLKKGGIAGEKKFEAALRDEGFFIAHPETFSIAEQIQLFKNAQVVAGFTGSAFHTFLMAKNNGAKLLHFSREKWLNENYRLCAKATGFNSQFHNFFIRFGEIKGANANVLQDLSAIWSVFYEQGLVKTKEYHDPEMENELKSLDESLKKYMPRLFPHIQS